MIDFDFPLLPHDSAAITVTTTVWVGVAVAAFFNLRLGWTLSALVVPGYLVPLLIARPTTGVVIFLEAILTYLIVRVVSDAPRLHDYWCSVFGRDRFFLIVIVSVLVRAICDGWILPYAGQIAVEHYGWNIDYRNNLQSFGLIVVALIANYFWKPGLIRGIGPLTTCIAITYVLVAYVLVGLTNFNLGNFHLLYEDISTSLMASPKAYIIVITTAYLASWINLRYAWDFNGILIPALLGLLWHDPFKIGVSIVEALIIYAIARPLLQLEFFKSKAIQGGRKLIFFFTVCFAFRLVLAHLLPFILPNVAVTDALGLGYLLTTLIAIKAYDKNLTIRMLRGTVQVSMLGAVAGSLIGFAFVCGPEIRFGRQDVVVNQVSDPSDDLDMNQSISELVTQGKILLYQKRRPESYQAPTRRELQTFSSALKQIKSLVRKPDGSVDRERLAKIEAQLASVNYELRTAENQMLFLKEQEPVRGWGMYVINPDQPTGVCVEVPAPLDEWATVESGLCILQNFPSCGLAIAGTPMNVNLNGSSNVNINKNSMFSMFHQVFGKSQPIQIRGLTREAIQSTAAQGSESSQRRSQLWVSGHLPESLDLPKLKSFVGGFDVYWSDRPTENRLRTGTRFAELVLARPDRRRLIARSTVGAFDGVHLQSMTDVVRSDLNDWLGQIKLQICNQGTDSYIPARLEEMMYMDQEVLQPLVKVLGFINPNHPNQSADETNPENSVDQNSEYPRWFDDRIASHFRAIDSTAKVLGYQLTIVVDPATEDQYVVLHESDPGNIKGWGTFVFRPGLQQDFVVEVPRPLFESRSFEFGLNLFHRPRGSALLIAGTHPRANLDGSADISRASNRTNLFNLVRHVLLRQLGDRPMLISQARSIQAPVQSDVVLASDSGLTSLDQLSPLQHQLVTQLQKDNLTTEFVSGSRDTAGYELGLMMQAAAVQVSQNKEVLSVWLSPSIRTKFRQQSDADSLAAQFNSCGIPTFDGSLADFVLAHPIEKEATEQATSLDRKTAETIKQKLTEYVENYDVLQLFNIVSDCKNWTFTRILDESSGQAFLAIQKDDHPPAIMNLTGFVGADSMQVDSLDGESVNQFMRSRRLWLEANTP